MEKRPNILLIIMDSVRAANVSCYGYHRKTTPNLDKLAQEGVLFEQAIAEGCWTLPVHSTLFTGLHQINHGIEVSQDALPENYPTLAKLLKDQQYQTCCFSNNAYISSGTGLTQGFDTAEDVWRLTSRRGIKRTKASRLILKLRKMGAVGEAFIPLVRMMSRFRKMLKDSKKTKDSGATITNDKIKQWLTAAWKKEQPFFLFANYMEGHESYGPPAPYNRKFMPSKYSPWRVLQVSPSKREVLAGPPRKRAEDLEIMTALYDGEINYLDAKLGELFEWLKGQGILENTVVIVAADHGDSLGEKNLLGHRMELYEPLVHVPLIIRYPEKFERGKRVSQQVQLTDLFPTILDLARAGRENLNTNGFFSLCDLAGLPRREYTVAENRAPKSMNSILIRMLRTDRYKYIEKSDGKHELYDLHNDPLEEKNLIQEKPQVAEDLQRKLDEWKRLHKSGAQSVEKKDAELDDDLVQRLKELGYM